MAKTKKARFQVVSMNEYLKVNNRFSEYGVVDTVENCLVTDSLYYDHAIMEARMLNGEDISFEEYNETMNSF